MLLQITFIYRPKLYVAGHFRLIPVARIFYKCTNFLRAKIVLKNKSTANSLIRSRVRARRMLAGQARTKLNSAANHSDLPRCLSY